MLQAQDALEAVEADLPAYPVENTRSKRLKEAEKPERAVKVRIYVSVNEAAHCAPGLCAPCRCCFRRPRRPPGSVASTMPVAARALSKLSRPWHLTIATCMQKVPQRERGEPDRARL